MNVEKLIKNIIDQVKEAQMKLGYRKETVHLYYPLSSLNAILETEYRDEKVFLTELKKVFSAESPLGELEFFLSRERITVSVPVHGVEYVHKKVAAPAFLADIIKLFQNGHVNSIEQISDIFSKYSEGYELKKMPEHSEFDYVLFFMDSSIDNYYYCLKEEMGHITYHRFTKEDYTILMSDTF